MSIPLCADPKCYNHGKYCRRPGHAPEKVKPFVAPKKESDSMKEVMREYKKEARKFITMHPKCQVCGKPSECVHHKKGRIGDNLMNKKTWMAVCLPCHEVIERKPAEAKANGHSESRLQKTKA